MKLFYPVDMSIGITQHFGDNPQNYPQRQGHPGIDFGTPVGSPLFAVCDGKVTIAQYMENGYGREISFTGYGYQFIYGHCLEILTGVGREVKRGEVIGYSGGALNDPQRGMSSGPHLHFEMRDLSKPQSLPLIGAVDPLPYLGGSLEIGEDMPDVAVDSQYTDMLPYVTVTTDWINIRRDNSTKEPPLGRVTHGMKLTTAGKPINGWYPVVFWVNDGGGEYLK